MQAQTDFAEQFMRELSQELGKPYSSFEGFVQVFRDNWVDSLEALLLLDEQSLAQLKFPLVLQKKIGEKIALLRSKAQTQPVATTPASTNYPTPPGSLVPPAETSKPQAVQTADEPDPLLEQQMLDLLGSLFKATLGFENFVSILQMLHTLLSNVCSHPEEPKYRLINLSKQAIQATIGSSAYAKELLRNLLFFENSQGNLELVGHPLPNLHELRFAVKVIQDYGNKAGTPLSPSGTPQQGRSRRHRQHLGHHERRRRIQERLADRLGLRNPQHAQNGQSGTRL